MDFQENWFKNEDLKEFEFCSREVTLELALLVRPSILLSSAMLDQESHQESSVNQ